MFQCEPYFEAQYPFDAPGKCKLMDIWVNDFVCQKCRRLKCPEHPERRDLVITYAQRLEAIRPGTTGVVGVVDASKPVEEATLGTKKRTAKDLVAICKSCPHSTIVEIQDDELKIKNRAWKYLVRHVGNRLRRTRTFKMRCKLCGCSSKLKASWTGWLIKKVSLGSLSNDCPEIGPDGLSNWRRGYVLKK